MTKRTLQASVFKSIIDKTPDMSPCMTYCDSLFNRSEVENYCRTVSDDVVFIGKGKQDCNYPNLSNTDNCVSSFERCVIRKMILHSTEYKLPQKTNNTVFQLQNGDFVRVVNILKCDNEGWVEIEKSNANKLKIECCKKIHYRAQNVILQTPSIRKISGKLTRTIQEKLYRLQTSSKSVL